MICPKCKQVLLQNNNTYKCLNNHSYDISKEGYVNLLLSKTNSGDNKILVKSRIDFLSKGYYFNLAIKIAEIIKKYNVKTLIDCGCGTGYYSNIIANNNSLNIYGIDISKEAIIQAAKKNKLGTFIVASNNDIPFEANYFDCALFIFSPLFENQVYRVLKNDGLIIIVSPGKAHLYELKKLLYENPYENTEDCTNISKFKLIDTIKITYKFSINNSDLHNLISMTPYLYKTDQNVISSINISNSIQITADFNISIYKRF